MRRSSTRLQKEDVNKNPPSADSIVNQENQNGNRKRKMASAEVARPKDTFSSPPSKKASRELSDRFEQMEVSDYNSEEDILNIAKALTKEVGADQMEVLNRFDVLIQKMRGFLDKVSKAKAAKLVRDLVEMFLDINAGPKGVERQIKACKEYIEWARDEKRTFLRQSLESRLIAVYYDQENFQEALALGGVLLKELKKVDDKNLLVEVLLLESRTYHSLGNLPRARAALTSARTTANSIYCPPKMQAALDLQSGILHAADEKDFKTAYSYFYEAFEGLDSIEDPKALQSLKYMLLSKIMLNTPEEVTSLLSGKLALKYGGRDVDAMRSVAFAAKNRSLAEFQTALRDYEPELKDDPVVKAHFATLYDKMMEQNLCRIIEPYSRVQVSHVAEKIMLDQARVEQKLSQMILDKKLIGVLDQANGLLILFDSNEPDKAYEAALGLIGNMGKVLDALYSKVKVLYN